MSHHILFNLKNRNRASLKPKSSITFSNIHELAGWLSEKSEILLKFSGCRDGKGYRLVEEVVATDRADKDGNDFKSYEIVGRKVDTYVHYSKTKENERNTTRLELYTLPHVTVNGLEKVQAYFDPKLKEFVKIKIPKK